MEFEGIAKDAGWTAPRPFEIKSDTNFRSELGEGPYRTAEIAKRLGRRPSYTSAPRDSLIKKGLIYSPDYGQVDFTVPKFSPFMRRRYPLERAQGSANRG